MLRGTEPEGFRTEEGSTMRRKLLATLAAFALAMVGAAPGIARTAPAPSAAADTAPVTAPAYPTDETKVPHYFGPWPNWANSQLTLPDVAVQFTGGGGTGAAATATIGANGAVTGLTITDPGSGYTSAPLVSFGGAGDGASATAAVNTTGSVTGVSVTNGGAGYTAPVVSFAGGSALPVTTTVGNPLVDRAFATDYNTAPAVVAASVTQVANHTFEISAGAATGGTFTLTVDGATSAPIAFDATALAVEGALTGASVTGSNPWTIVFAAADPVVSMDGTGLTIGVTDAAASVGATPDVWNVGVGSATGGSFTLAVDATPTSVIPWNATALDVETAVSLVSPATVTGSGSAIDPWVITFTTAPADVTIDAAGLVQPATGFGVTAAATWTADIGTATGGTFTLTADGATTSPLAFDASAATVEAALTGATVTGLGPWTIVFATPPSSVSIDGTGLTQPGAPTTIVPVFTVVPKALPVGSLLSFETWNQATAGGSPTPSAGQTFHAYVLRPTGADYTVVYDSGLLTVPALVDPLGEVASYPAPNVPVLAGDVLGFYGSGIPVDTGAGADIFSYPAPTAPAVSDVVSIGSAGFPLYGQAREYSFAATVSDTSGVLPVTTEATATAFGGVDAVTITDPGSGYTMPTVDFDFPDDPAGVQAEGHTMCAATTGPDVACSDAGAASPLVITSVVVDQAGSGYSAAPGVVIRDGTAADPILGSTAASATATLTISDRRGRHVRLRLPGSAARDDHRSHGHGRAGDRDDGHRRGLGPDTQQRRLRLPPARDHQVRGRPARAVPAPRMPPVHGLPGCQVHPPRGAGEQGVQRRGCRRVRHRPRPVQDQLLLEPRTRWLAATCSWRPPTTRRSATLAGREHAHGRHDRSRSTRADGVTQWLAVTPPQWLGPTIGATKDKPVRIVFHNLLPTGADGNLFLPTDSTLMGSGMGPMDMPAPTNDGTVMDGVRNPECTELRTPSPTMCFTENRATLHLHGGITPWISDGTPHQWITPANENTRGRRASPSETSPTWTVVHRRRRRLPDLLLHEPAVGAADVLPRPCVGHHAPERLRGRGRGLPDHRRHRAEAHHRRDDPRRRRHDPARRPGPHLRARRRLQLAQQDPTWDTADWGGMGSFWYHHVYMPAQNPGDPSGMSAYGRWMYGPWFWPPPPPNAHYQPDRLNPVLTTRACNLDDPATWQYQSDPFCEPELIPGTPNISVGMEQFNDTPIVNGVGLPDRDPGAEDLPPPDPERGQ